MSCVAVMGVSLPSLHRSDGASIPATVSTAPRPHSRIVITVVAERLERMAVAVWMTVSRRSAKRPTIVRPMVSTRFSEDRDRMVIEGGGDGCWFQHEFSSCRLSSYHGPCAQDRVWHPFTRR
jgi:hypothetical protein